MDNNRKIQFLLPDGNLWEFQINESQKKDQVYYYRNIAKDLKLQSPEEFVIVYDFQQKKVISKFYDKLDPERKYKLFYIQQAMSIIEQKDLEMKQFKESIQRLEQQIQDDKIKSEDEIKLIKSESENQNNQLKQKFDEVEKNLKERQEKIQDLKKDLESANYNVKIADAQQQTLKKDFDQKFKEKQNQLDQAQIQLQKQAEDLTKFLNELKQEKQNTLYLNEQYQTYYHQTQTMLQKWQQYCSQLEYEKKWLEDIKAQAEDEVTIWKKKHQAAERDQKESKDQIEQLLSDKQNLDNQIQKLKKELRELQNRNQEDILNLKAQIDLQQLNYKEQQDKATIQVERQTKKCQQLQNELDQFIAQRQNDGQVKAGEQQLLLSQLNQEKESKTSLQKDIDNLNKKISDLQTSLNNSRFETNNLKNKLNNEEQKVISIQEELNQEKENKQQQIEQLKKQIEQMSEQKQKELKEYYKKSEDDLQRWSQQQEKSENEIKRLKGELEKVMNEKKKDEEENRLQRQVLQKQITSMDTKLLEKDQELIAIQNSAIVPVYQFRIQRLVEKVPRDYHTEIESAIETMMSTKDFNLEKFLNVNKAKCKQQDFKIFQVKLNKKAETTLYNISDQDYRQCIDLVPIGDFTGIQCLEQVMTNQDSFDKYFLIKCLKFPQKKQYEGKIFGIKQFKNLDAEELETKETAMDTCLSTVISQDFMNKFVKELKDKNAKNIIEFKFREQFIIETKKDFKKILQEQFENLQHQPNNQGIQYFKQFIEAMNNEQSNEFYEYTREYQLDKKQPRDGNIMQAYLQIQNDHQLQKLYNTFNPDIIRKELNHFIDFIGGNVREMPQKLFYAIQEIEVKPDFVKYNGGHVKFVSSQEGKFLSAFTYYSIIKSQRQLSISHLQGVQNYLYDPLISTYDGFLDKQDQGYDEIRTMESKFLSCPNIEKGIEYLQALDIKGS